MFPRLAERRGQYAGTMSGGEQQMLAIGRCLMGKPELIMFDEPSLGLAPAIVQEVFRVIERLNAEGTTVILVEQNVAVSLTLAQHAYVLLPEQWSAPLPHGGDAKTLAAWWEQFDPGACAPHRCDPGARLAQAAGTASRRRDQRAHRRRGALSGGRRTSERRALERARSRADGNPHEPRRGCAVGDRPFRRHTQ